MSDNYNLDWSTTAEEAKVNGVKLMVYGDSGLGKTVLTATMPTPFVISAESGLLSLAPGNLRRIHGDDATVARNFPVIKVKSMAQFRDAVRWAAESHEAQQFESGCVDSATEIFEVILKNAHGNNADGRAAYGSMHTDAIDLLKQFRDIPGLNVYMSSKMAKLVNPITNFTKCAPMAPGKRLTWDIPYLFDLMFALRQGEDEQGTYRYLQTGPCLQYEAKDRSGALDMQEMPHLGNIIEKIKASGFDPDDTSTHVYQQVHMDSGNYSEDAVG
jgi:hypothetical protein